MLSFSHKGDAMKKIVIGFKTTIQLAILIVVVLIANISTTRDVNSISSLAQNRVINLTTMAMKLENDIKNDLYSAKDTFTGDVTGYGADCPLCSGKLSCVPSYNVRNGTTIYPDVTYGNVRIVASSKNLPCGSIVRFNLSKLSNEPIVAIVLDRGVLGTDLDLLMPSENDASMYVGRNTLSYDVLRVGY